MSSKDTLKQTLVVAILLCLVCSVVVSFSAVSLKGMQAANKEFARNRDVLIAAGLYDPGTDSKADVEAKFADFKIRLVDLDTGKYLTDAQMAELGIDPATYDQRKVAKSKDDSLTKPVSVSGLGFREQARYALVYVLEKDGKVDRVVLPMHGYGLWSVMYGFMAVEGDGNTILGMTFYEHGETPGLGGEVDNPRWKAQWPGKHIFGEDGELAITVTKGGMADLNSASEIDGLSGATLTTVGINNLVHYWLGPNGFGSYLANLKAGGA